MRKFLLMSKAVLIVCLLFSSTFSSLGQQLFASTYSGQPKIQTESKTRSLKEVLKELESRHKIVFSYESQLLENKFVKLPKEGSSSLEEELEDLLEPLSLFSKKLDERMYVIIPIHNKELKKLQKMDKQQDEENSSQLNYSQDNLQELIKKTGTVLENYADVPVRGRITDNTGGGLPGVSVVVKGTTIGTVSDNDGKYSLTVPDANSTIVFSFIGYVSQEVTVGARSSIDIVMALDVRALSEVVVTGYQSQQKREVTGAISTLSAKDLVSIPQSSIEQQLQGRVAGVSVITSGQPGTVSQVRIRGFGSFTNNNPLYIVDGVPTFDISYLNPNDIESTTVLKDAATASIYGARASSGVILYTTKKGKTGNKGIRVSYDASYGVQNPGDGYDILNPTETMEATRTALTNAGKALDNDQYGKGGDWQLPDYIKVGALNGVRESDINNPRSGYEGVKAGLDPSLYNVNADKGAIYQIVRANKSGTDWFKELTSPAPLQNHTLSVMGSGDASRFYISMGYFNQEGIVKNTYMKRYTLRANTEFSIKDRIRIGENFQVSLIDDPNFTSIFGSNSSGVTRGFNNLNEGNALSHAYRMNPLVPVYDINGGYGGTAAKGFNNPKNPIAMQDRALINKGYNFGSFGNLFAEVDLIKGMTFRTSFGGRFMGIYGYGMTSKEYENSENIGNYTVYENSGFGYGWTWTNTLNYQIELGSSKITALAGVEAIKDNYFRYLNGNGNDPLSINPTFVTLSSTQSANRNVFSGGFAPTKVYSIFGKVDYSFKQRYLASVTLRRDASSNFSKNERVGVFPAVSAGWMLSEESFMENIGFINSLKIRGSWGLMGNQNAPLTNQYNLYGINPSYNSYDINGGNTTLAEGIVQSTLANPNTKWEANETINIGFNGNFLNNTLEVTFDVYQKNTRDLLFSPTLPGVLGGNLSVNPPTVNIGSVSNRGIDLQIIKRGKIGNDWRYEGDLTLTSYMNEIKKVAEGVTYFEPPSPGSTRLGASVTRNSVGQSISEFYGYEVEGLFQNSEDVTNHATQDGAAPGRFKYKDINKDGAITPDDRTYIGNPNPDFTYGLTLKVGYKAFDLETTFYGVQGSSIFNYTRWFTDFYPSFPGQALSRRAGKESWSETNRGGTTPRLEDVSNFSTNQVVNSYYVENGSYLRNRNLKLSYTLPQRLVNRTGADLFTVYIQTVNLFTATKYQGLDPGVSGVDTNFGIDYGNYPVVKQFLIGVNVGF